MADITQLISNLNPEFTGAAVMYGLAGLALFGYNVMEFHFGLKVLSNQVVFQFL